MASKELLYKPVYDVATKQLAHAKDGSGVIGALLDNVTRQVSGQARWIPVKPTGSNWKFFVGAGGGFALLEIAHFAFPHVKKWIVDIAAPSVKRALHKAGLGKTLMDVRQDEASPQSEEISQISSDELSYEVDSAYSNYKNDMHSMEAQRRIIRIIILAAVLAKEMRTLINANICGGNTDTLIKWQTVMDKLTVQDVRESVNDIFRGVSLVDDMTMEAFEVLFGKRIDKSGAYIPLEKNDFDTALRISEGVNISTK